MNKILEWKWYMLAGFLYLLATVLKWELTMELLRLTLLPVAFGYYAFKFQKINLWVWVLLLSYYGGDIFRSFHDMKWLPLQLGFYAVGHTAFMYISYKCIKDLKVRRLLFSAIPFVALWLVYFNYSIKDIFGPELGENFLFTQAYSILLSLFLLVALIKFFNDEKKVYLFTLICAISFVGGDIMSGMYDFVAPEYIFKVAHAFASAAGYFFLTRFILDFDFKQVS